VVVIGVVAASAAGVAAAGASADLAEEIRAAAVRLEAGN